MLFRSNVQGRREILGKPLSFCCPRVARGAPGSTALAATVLLMSLANHCGFTAVRASASISANSLLHFLSSAPLPHPLDWLASRRVPECRSAWSQRLAWGPALRWRSHHSSTWKACLTPVCCEPAQRPGLSDPSTVVHRGSLLGCGAIMVSSRAL